MQVLLQFGQILIGIASMTVVFITILFALYICCFNSGSDSFTEDTGLETTIPQSVRKEFPQLEIQPSGIRSAPWIQYPKTRTLRTRSPAKTPIAGVSRAVTVVKRPPALDDQREVVEARRGGEFIGNRMRFKVKVLNNTKYTITDVTVFLISYPSKALRINHEDRNVSFPKIEPEGFRSPTFDFLPTQDCVKGEIVAGVSYMDYKGEPHTLNTKPFVIRSVCDLLLPDKITPEDFESKLKDLECGELVVKVSEWTPEEMFDKSLKILAEANFFKVHSESGKSDGTTFATITGFAKGKYTGKEIGVKISITGRTEEKGASCTIQVSGEDQAMILPAIDDLRERLSAWLCPNCSSPLSLENVEKLKDGQVVVCPFCNVPIGR
ncbi:MAG: hypothetical protein ACFFCP_13000 [Promethearchaeota archaeon]